jgi:hypothetical protein
MGAAGLITRNTTAGVANNSKQDGTDNDVVITLTNGVVTDLTVGTPSYTTFGGVGLSAQRLQDSVKVSGSKLIIDIGGTDATTWGTTNTSWNFDWDFGANYHVELDAGIVKAGAGGPANLAMTNDQTLNFTTVTPVDGTTGAASQKMVSTDASLTSGFTYHNAHQGSTSGLQAGAIDLNFATGAHALVIQVNSVNATNPQLLKTSLGGNTDIAGFGIDDVLSNDNGGNMLLKSIEGLTGATWSGSGNATTAATNGSTLKRTVDTDVSGQATWTWFGDAPYTVGAGFGDSRARFRVPPAAFNQRRDLWLRPWGLIAQISPVARSAQRINQLNISRKHHHDHLYPLFHHRRQRQPDRLVQPHRGDVLGHLGQNSPGVRQWRSRCGVRASRHIGQPDRAQRWQ